MNTLFSADEVILNAAFRQSNSNGMAVLDCSDVVNVLNDFGVYMTRERLLSLLKRANLDEKSEFNFESFSQLLLTLREAAQTNNLESVGDHTASQKKIAAALDTKLFLSDSWMRVIFDLCIGVVALAYFAVVLLDDVTTYITQPAMTATEIATTVFFTLDLVVSALTYRGTDRLAVDAMKYFRTWGMMDFISLFPWWLLVGYAGLSLRHLRLIKLLKFSEFWRESGRVLLSPLYTVFHYKILPVTLLAVTFLILVHGFSTGFVYIKQASSTSDSSYPYISALYYVVYTLTTVGYGTVTIANTNEKLYAILVMCGSILTNGFIIGKLVAIMCNADIQKSKTGALRQTLSVLEHFDVPSPLEDEVLRFQDHMLGQPSSAFHAATLAGMPDEMHNNIRIVVLIRLLSCAPFFQDLDTVVKVALSHSMQRVFLVPEQFVLGFGEEVRRMFFIDYGLVDVVGRNGDHLRTLTSNHFFGQGMLFEGAVSTVAVKAVSYCDLWSISRHAILRLAQSFPALKLLLSQVAGVHEFFDFEKGETHPPTAEEEKRFSRTAAESQSTEGSACLEDGELENAAEFNALRARAERLQILSRRTQDCHLRLRKLCESRGPNGTLLYLSGREPPPRSTI